MKSAASNENHLPTGFNFSDYGLPAGDVVAIGPRYFGSVIDMVSE